MAAALMAMSGFSHDARIQRRKMTAIYYRSQIRRMQWEKQESLRAQISR